MSTTADTSLLAEYIDLPTVVLKSDYVVTLTSGIADPARTIADYEPTPKLVECFDRALAMVAASVRDQKSNAAFLHGSFGSGKSHFMAILDLVLDGNAAARSIPELGPVVAKHNKDLQGRKMLVVPFHFVGASTMEQIVLGGYVEHIAQRHPGAPTPNVYVSDGLIDDAVKQRALIGDDGFFNSLSHAQGVDDGWGDDAGSWDAARFDAAVAASPGSELRDGLVSALLDTIFSAMKNVAASTANGFVPFDQGLQVISAHAKTLGYDAVVLFCDELVLWLAGRIAEAGFVGREAQKLAKLVDADRSKRPVPIVSFIARQRDLRELVGEQNAGSEQAAVADALKFWEGRFDTITFADNNLPLIAQRRLLRPRGEAARLAIDDVFARVRAETEQRGEFDVLTTDTSTAQEFRMLYPFSPALVAALVALAGAMQRERTALKAMAQLLSEQRDTLRLGTLVPAGDLFDVIASGEEPLSAVMAGQVRAAKKLWAERFVPLIARDHHVAEQAVAGVTSSLPAGHGALVDARLVKTLLIAALVPEVSAFRNLNVGRLTALNSGVVKGWVTGAEQKTVLGKVRAWASEIGELRVGDDDHNPTVSLQLTGVDVRSIMDAVRSIDNRDLRRRYVRDLLSKQIGLNREGLMGAMLDVEWRGTKRRAEVVFANIRDTDKVPEVTFRAGAVPKLVIDYPFDEPDEPSPRSDFARVETSLIELNEWTLCWMPNFFTETIQRQLADCVLLEHLLTNDQFEANAAHISPNDRLIARGQLANQQSALNDRLLAACRQAYGLAAVDSALVTAELSPSEQFAPLDAAMSIQPPAAPGFREAAASLVGSLWSFKAPRHPNYSGLVTRPELVRALETVRRAAREPNFRLDNVERAQRPELAKIVPALQLGLMGDAHVVLGQHWKDHFERLAAERRPERLTVGLLRSWIDEPEPMCLPADHADLVIASFVIQTNRELRLGGTEVKPEIGKMADQIEVRTPVLPDEATWLAAREHASQLGVMLPTFVSSAAVATADGEIAGYLTPPRGEHARALVDRLRAWYLEFGVDASSARLATAQSATNLVTALQAGSGDVIATLATFTPASSFAAIGTSLAQAAATVSTLDSVGTASLTPAIALATNDTWRSEATLIGEQLSAALRVEEHAGTRPLTETVRALHRDAQALLAKVATAAAAPVIPPIPPVPPSGPGGTPSPAAVGGAVTPLIPPNTVGTHPQSRASLVAQLEVLKGAAASLHLELRYELIDASDLSTP